MRSLWAQVPFIGRLLITACTALLVAGIATLLISARQDANELQIDLRQELAKELDILQSAMTEPVVLGDFASLQQLLNRHVKRPTVNSVEFHDAISGIRLVSRAISPPPQVPNWFLSLLEFREQHDQALIEVGGQHYGSLHLTLNPVRQAERAWLHFRSHMGILLFAILIDFIGIWWVLRSSLSPLKALEQGAQTIAAGKLDTQLPSQGSPEFRHVIDSFNHMACTLNQALSDLQISKERLTCVLEATGDGIWDWDIERNQVTHNARWGNILGLTDVPPAHPVDFFSAHIHPDDRPRVLSHLEQALTTPIGYEIEYRMNTQDGRTIWVRDRGQVVARHSDGRPARMVGAILDITATKLLEQDLADKMQQMSTILDNSSVGISLVRKRLVVWSNQRMREMFGVPPETPVGHDTLIYYYDAEDHRQLGLKAYPVLASGKRYTCEQIMRHQGDGHPLWMRISGKAIAPDNPDAGSIWIFEDIAQQKTDERALIEAREQAESANVAKSRFLATMSHEIRTPMNGILGMAQLLQNPDLSVSDRQHCTQVILQSGKTLLTLINDILDLSKVEAGKVEIASEPFDPYLLTQEVVVLFSEVARNKGLDLAITSRAVENPTLYLGDPTHLRMMLSNLVSNAIKFTAQGHVHIQIQPIDPPSGSTPQVEWSVTDTGIGVSEQQQAHIFDPFTQADNSITRRYGGTGLGLALVRSYARLMAGEAGVESTFGAGSRFWFRIPLPHSPLSEQLAPSPLPPTLAAPQWQGEVLVVEDHPINRQVIGAILEHYGLCVTMATNGQEGVDAVLSGKTFHLVLMDLQMPVLDGYAATERIRAWEQQSGHARTPIVALTANAFDDDRQRCLATDMDGFMTKPIQQDQIQEVLSRWLSQPPSAPPPTPSAADATTPAIQEALSHLRRMLNAHQFDAIGAFYTLQQAVKDTSVSTPIAQLRPLVEQFEFERVLLRLGQIFD